MIKSRKQMYLAIGAFALVLMLGTVTYAFFNYTRTGSSNIIKTGRIYFNSEQGTAINLTNLFPIDPTETGIMNDASKVGTVTINVTGDTTYTGGIEYLVSAVNVQNTVGNKQLPISIDVSYSANGNGKVIGTEDEEYFDNRGGNTSIYKVLAGDTISNNEQLVVGYIARGATGIDGNIVIKAYIDVDKVAISDTYDGEESDNMGTTSEWVDGREVFTTEEWNQLQTNGVSFQVRVEANEGTWVEAPSTLASCPGEGCVYTYTMNTLYTTWNISNETPSELTSSDYVENYEDIENVYGVKSFFGLVLDNGRIVRAYSCGIYLGNPFCIEGSPSGEKKTENDNLLYPLFGNYDNENENGCYDGGSSTTHCYSEQDEFGKRYSIVNEESEVRVSYNWDMCIVRDYGTIQCYND